MCQILEEREVEIDEEEKAPLDELEVVLESLAGGYGLDALKAATARLSQNDYELSRLSNLFKKHFCICQMFMNIQFRG